ncbi:chromate efflux transporter [Microcoleus sp. FACHB-68]|uniref:chromate efflux transporter n=1 Tax=Microcoleus sp. FACHB-68 TaxID=2692826 RepID=UPI0016879AD2|nr:chromate efflux transporter [Microcoleus sp. FACHB-68]MBD1936426.1 chromate efflux transporter [Microcoleus sp. FACHB-68]
MDSSAPHRLPQLAKVFFKLGAIGFGGPAAHIAMMEDEVVNRHKWLTREQFLDLVGATNLIPGPNSTEMAIHVGYIYAGWLGLIVAGICFIGPAVVITGAFAWAYVVFGQLPQVAPLLYGIKPAVLAIILGAIWKLGKTAVKNRKLLLIAVAVVVALFLGLNEVIALLLGGLLGMLWLRLSQKRNNGTGTGFNGWLIGFSFHPLLSQLSTASPVASPAAPTLWQLGLFFLKVGSVLFGSGYVLVAFLEEGLVGQGWLTQQQLLDAIAIGQFTPGPVSSTATFIGYVIAGWPGAVVATLGIFLPSFLFVAALNPLIPRLRSSPWASAFLDAVNVSAIALMAAVTVQLARGTLLVSTGTQLNIDWPALFIAIIAAGAAIRLRVSAVWLVLGGALMGWLANLILING